MAVLCRALLQHTKEKCLKENISKDYSSDSFKAEVEETKVNRNILQTSNNFDLTERVKWTRDSRRMLFPTLKSGSDSLRFLKTPSNGSSIFKVMIAERALYPFCLIGCQHETIVTSTSFYNVKLDC